ncbi:MAG TPA: hypothetical protein VFS00_06515 [Polyangiaceae bacterium]|nr:hypothetical protein [Polyangiaceae bacterium]
MRFGLVLLVLLAGCGGRPPQKAAASSPLPPLPPPGADAALAVPADAPPEFPDEVDSQLTPIDKASHDRARAAALAGDWHQAKRLFARLAFAYPEHPILLAQYNAVAARVEQAQAAAKAALEALPLRTPAAPPAAYALARAAPAGSGGVPSLVKQSEKPNRIVDDEEWFVAHDLRLPQYFIEPPGGMLWAPALLSRLLAVELKPSFVFVEYSPSRRYLEATLPLEVPPAYGSLPLTRAIDSSPYLVAFYGDRVVVTFDEAKRVVAAFDLVNLGAAAAAVTKRVKVAELSVTTPEGTRRGALTREAPSIELKLRYALAADGVLYVEHMYNGYTKDAKGQTGYLTAFDLATGDLLWRSAPQVCNVENFLVLRGGLVCGYGFTAEPRWLTVIDRATGATKQKTQISTTPDLFVPKGGAIYVRGYRSDFVFAVR